MTGFVWNIPFIVFVFSLPAMGFAFNHYSRKWERERKEREAQESNRNAHHG